MNTVRLSVIIPTIGRPTLARTLNALLPQLGQNDEVLIIAPEVGVSEPGMWLFANIAGTVDGRFRLDRHGHTGGFGDEQRNHALGYASGTHVCFIDDDDEHTPLALATFRAHAQDHPVLFRVTHPELGELPRQPVLECGNVTTQMILAPNDPARLGWFESVPPGGRTGDFTFIRDTVRLHGNHVSWRPEHVAVLHREPA